MFDQVQVTPTFLFGIGAQKSGTTWLYRLLKQHPECHCSETKELHYFDVLHRRGEQTHLNDRVALLQRLTSRLALAQDASTGTLQDQINRLSQLIDMYPENPSNHSKYLSVLLDGYSGQKLACDITPSYATLDRAVFHDMSKLGQSKFIFIMRDPVDRMWSQIRMALSHGGRALSDEAFQDACAMRARDLHASGRLPRIPRADYARTMIELEAAIPRDRIMYLFFEKMFDPNSIARLWSFLEIPPLSMESRIRTKPGRVVSLPTEIEQLLFNGLQHQYEVVFNRFGETVPAEWSARYRACYRKRPAWFGRLFGH